MKSTFSASISCMFKYSYMQTLFAVLINFIIYKHHTCSCDKLHLCNASNSNKLCASTQTIKTINYYEKVSYCMWRCQFVQEALLYQP